MQAANQTAPLMTLRAKCVHGKVRAMVTGPRATDSPEKRSHLLREWQTIQRSARVHATDCVTLQEARLSDMDCELCDGRRR